MPAPRVLSPNSVWDRPALLEAFRERGIIKAEQHVQRVYSALLRDPDISWVAIPNLPKAATAVLGERFSRATTRVLEVQRSACGDTTKLLIQLQDGMQVEAVVMAYDTTERYNTAAAAGEPQRGSGNGSTGSSGKADGGSGGDATDMDKSSSGADGRDGQKDQGSMRQLSAAAAAETEEGQQTAPSSSGRDGWGHRRGTLCVSSQVGCQMGCTFCATGTMGLRGNLTSGEIVEQLVHAGRETSVRNIVMMGMGEPLSNYEAVRAAVGMMTDPAVFGLSRRRVTVSTVGVVPRIRDMARDMPGVSLALSLHAPDQELRRAIVPSARAYPLDRLMAAVSDYQAATGQRVFVEYVMLSGVNDGDERAHALGRLLQGRDAHVNLIPWNPVLAGEGISYAAPAPGSVAEFQAIVKSYGLNVTVRQEKGQDISGACGQLVIDAAARSGGGAAAGGGGGRCGGGGGGGERGVRDIEDLAAAV